MREPAAKTAAIRAPKRAADERRRLILQGARAVFAASGYANVNTTRVARAAGVSAPALYRYFPSKKRLYVATLEHTGRQLVAVWRRTIEAAADPLAAVWTLGLGYYDHVRSHTPATRLWFRALADGDDPEIRTALAAGLVGGVELFERNLERGKALGLVKRDLDTRVAAWHFMTIGLTFDLIHLLGRDRELDRRKVEAWGRLYLDSIRAPARARAPRAAGAVGAPPRERRTSKAIGPHARARGKSDSPGRQSRDRRR